MSNAIGKTNLLIINEHIKLRIAKEPWFGGHNAQNNTDKERSGHFGGAYGSPMGYGHGRIDLLETTFWQLAA